MKNTDRYISGILCLYLPGVRDECFYKELQMFIATTFKNQLFFTYIDAVIALRSNVAQDVYCLAFEKVYNQLTVWPNLIEKGSTLQSIIQKFIEEDLDLDWVI